MSEREQGEQRSWWEKPDPEQASRDPYRDSDDAGTDARGHRTSSGDVWQAG